MKITEAPLGVFDVETTGVKVDEDRVVEFGMALFNPGSKDCERRRVLVNPQRPIPMEAAKIHGISDDKVADCEPFGAHLDRIAPYFKDRVLVGYNAIFFDMPLINADAARCGHSFRITPERLIDVMVFVNWHHRGERSRKLGDISAMYGVVAQRGKAHSAAVDCQMTGELLLAMVKKGIVPDDVDEALAQQERYRVIIDGEYKQWDYWIFRDRQTGRLRMGAGKYAGQLLSEVDKSYLSFMITKATDMRDTVREAFDNASKGKLHEEVQTSIVDTKATSAASEDDAVLR